METSEWDKLAATALDDDPMLDRLASVDFRRAGVHMDVVGSARDGQMAGIELLLVVRQFDVEDARELLVELVPDDLDSSGDCEILVKQTPVDVITIVVHDLGSFEVNVSDNILGSSGL